MRSLTRGPGSGSRLASCLLTCARILLPLPAPCSLRSELPLQDCSHGLADNCPLACLQLAVKSSAFAEDAGDVITGGSCQLATPGELAGQTAQHCTVQRSTSLGHLRTRSKVGVTWLAATRVQTHTPAATARRAVRPLSAS